MKRNLSGNEVRYILRSERIMQRHADEAIRKIIDNLDVGKVP